MKKKNIMVCLIILIFSLSVTIYIVKVKLSTSNFKLVDRETEIMQVKKKDKSVVGWLMVEGTNIDLPIVQDLDTVNVPDREFNHAWILSKPDSESNHVTFISHNVRNVSRRPIVNDDSMTGFEQLMSFIYPTFISKNQYIAYTNRRGEQEMYKIYAVSLTKIDQSASFHNIYTDEEQEKYINESKEVSMYDMNVDVTKKDKLLSLMTCTRFYGKADYRNFRVDARKLREDEKQELVKVRTNNNYKEIEKRMKEGVSNEEA